MVEKETKNNQEIFSEPIREEIIKVEPQESERKKFKKMYLHESVEKSLESWVPKTSLGKRVKEGKEKDIDSILFSGKKILEAEIVDSLVNLESDLLLIGQAKGKFGGGKRRAWRQTQRKTMEGNIVTFSCMAVVGDKKGHVGIGYGKAKENLPARAKGLRQAKLNIISVKRGYESVEEDTNDPHTVPYIVKGKCGSVRIKLIPAPRGTGLVVGDECKKILRLAGIQDVYGVSDGQTRTTFNLAKACIDALKKTWEIKR